MCINIIIDGGFHVFDNPLDDFVSTLLYIDYRGIFFPDNQWVDFTNPVLDMWQHNLIAARYSENVKFALYFMDGPFRLDVFKDDKMQLTIDAIKFGGKNELMEFTVQCSYCDLLKALYEAIKYFNYMLYSKGIYKGKFESVYQHNINSLDEIRKILNQEINN